MAAEKHTNNSSVSNYDLMETIRRYQIIYDKSCDDPLLKKDAWARVADELHIDAAEAQNRYGNIRTVFSRHLKSIRRRRSAGSDGGTRRLEGDVNLNEGFEYLRWLIRFIKPRHTVGKGKAVSGDVDNSSDEECEDGGGAGNMWADLLKEALVDSDLAAARAEGKCDRRTGPEPNPSTSGGTGSKSSTSVSKHGLRNPRRKFLSARGKRSWSAAAVGDLLGAASPAAATMTVAQAADEDMLFCLSLAPKMRRLPERFKTAAQLRILQVICDFEMSDASPSQEPA